MQLNKPHKAYAVTDYATLPTNFFAKLLYPGSWLAFLIGPDFLLIVCHLTVLNIIVQGYLSQFISIAHFL